MKSINSLNELHELSKGAEKHFILLYKSKSEPSKCAIANILAACKNITIPVFSADVAQVKDIHTYYNIKTVPSFLIFENGKFINSISSCQSETFYNTLLKNASFHTSTSENQKTQKRVSVYSTPTCTWCNTLKKWLDKHSIRYRDIDISKDQNAAENLMKKSGQQGVPQTDINGTIVVGFDENKLKKLLEITN
ncbi:MAG: hypothetical protein M0Q45_10870 [Bacteroidales bacterium]|jgi:glutaredoxin-like YruB-family protein|nr:hypothetical protein [Bacteroidales bacterium]MCK9499989.1 hypothetical protein [Bacteroidales bacterium]MDY0315369.1 glutaredoxin domain-containing protein [Bacteroidales bacterium]